MQNNTMPPSAAIFRQFVTQASGRRPAKGKENLSSRRCKPQRLRQFHFLIKMCHTPYSFWRYRPDVPATISTPRSAPQWTAQDQLKICSSRLISCGGNLVDIQTHDKLSLRPRYSTNARRKYASNASVISGVRGNANDLGDKMKNCCYGNMLPFHEQNRF